MGLPEIIISNDVPDGEVWLIQGGPTRVSAKGIQITTKQHGTLKGKIVNVSCGGAELKEGGK